MRSSRWIVGPERQVSYTAGSVPKESNCRSIDRDGINTLGLLPWPDFQPGLLLLKPRMGAACRHATQNQ